VTAPGSFPQHSVDFPRTFRVSVSLLLFAMLGLCVMRLWLMPLPSSFWVDELGTVFVVRHGASEPSLRAAPQVADSIYYVLPTLAGKLAGTNEISYRLFSVLAMGGALFAIARLAARLIDPRAAWLAVFGCLASRSFNYEAADARPYALGSLVLTWAILLLVRWLDSGRVRDALLFAAAASLLWWVHLIFWPFYLLFFLYAGFRIGTAQTSIGWLPLVALFSAIAIATAPVAFRALSLLHQAGEHVVVAPPHFNDLTVELKLGLMTGIFTVGSLAAGYFGWRSPQISVSSASMLLIGGWWLIDPLALFGFSRITGNSVFVARYMYLALPGMTLAALVLVARFIPAGHWRSLALGLGAAVFLFGGHWNHFRLPHHNSDWKAAATALREWTRGEEIPVICPSPFIEARSPVWSPDYPVSGFLYSHLSFYPMGGRVYPFPFESSREVEAYARTLSLERLSRSPRFAIYGGDRSVRFWRQWFAARPELDDWENRMLGVYGDVNIVVFEPRLEAQRKPVE